MARAELSANSRFIFAGRVAAHRQDFFRQTAGFLLEVLVEEVLQPQRPDFSLPSAPWPSKLRFTKGSRPVKILGGTRVGPPGHLPKVSEAVVVKLLATKPPEKGTTMKRTNFRLLLGAFGGLTALLCGPVPALAQTAPPLGVAQQFAVLGNSGVTGSTGAGTVVDGDVGSSPTATISNFPPSSVVPPFILHLTNDLTVQQAHTDAIAAYNFLAAQGPGTVLAAQLDGAVLTSGIYSFMGGAADLASGGTLTLDGPGIFVFQVDSALTANTLSNVTGTADPCSVFWRVGSSATLNGDSFRGNVIADASITVGSGSNLTGRALAGTGPTGAVTMAGAGGNTIGGCAPGGSVIAIPTLDQGGMALLIALLAGAAVLVIGRRSFSSS